MEEEKKGTANKNPLKEILNFFYQLTDLTHSLDKKKSAENIKNNKRMQGANAWMLMCSIMIASLGLDLNSPAVIIGAMLISPLMSPILGVGLAVGTNDQKTLFTSLNHFLIAIGIALVTSTLYFFLTPLGTPTAEILARTKPTFLDVLIAFFGGVAGIISGSQKDTSNAIPGVAIATALMPPLCVTGFGLANLGNASIDGFNVAISSFYLFFLNSTFVALATYTIVRFLRFPGAAHANNKEANRTRMIMLGVSLLLIIPSFFILEDVYKEQRNDVLAENFINSFLEDKIEFIDQWNLVGPEPDGNSKLILKVYGNIISAEDIRQGNERLKSMGLKNTEIEVIPTSEIDLTDLDELQTRLADNFNEITAKLDQSKIIRSEKDEEIANLTSKLDSLSSFRSMCTNVINESKILIPEIKEISIGELIRDGTSTPTSYIKWSKPKYYQSIKNKEKRVAEFIKMRLSLDTLIIISE